MTFSSSKQLYNSTDKYVKWTIENKCDKTQYYLIGLQVKSDTGWVYINPYVHAIMQKGFLAILAVAPKKKLADKVELDKILREQSFKNINARYRQYRLTLDFFKRRDFEATANVPTRYAYFEIRK